MNATSFQPVESASPKRLRPEIFPARPAADRPLTILQATYAEDYRTIATYLLRRTGDDDLAQELASETFAEAIRSLDRWNARGLPLRAWLFRIATRRLAHHRRRKGRAARVLARMFASRAASVPTHTIWSSDAARVREAVSRLRPCYQDVLVLHHVEELSVPEIALTLGVAEGTVKSRLARARTEMQGHLADLGFNT